MEWPGVTPSSLEMVSTMASEPQSLQGVVVQTWRKYLPTGSRLYLRLECNEEGLMGMMGMMGITLCRRWRLHRLA